MILTIVLNDINEISFNTNRSLTLGKVNTRVRVCTDTIGTYTIGKLQTCEFSVSVGQPYAMQHRVGKRFSPR